MVKMECLHVLQKVEYLPFKAMECTITDTSCQQGYCAQVAKTFWRIRHLWTEI